jgi:hypothetical protein
MQRPMTQLPFEQAGERQDECLGRFVVCMGIDLGRREIEVLVNRVRSGNFLQHWFRQIFQRQRDDTLIETVEVALKYSGELVL